MAVQSVLGLNGGPAAPGPGFSAKASAVQIAGQLKPTTQQAVMQAASTALGVTGASQVTMLVSHYTGFPKNVRTAQSILQTSFTAVDEATPQTIQTVIQAATTALVQATSQVTGASMLVAYRTGPIENLDSRAWTFPLDGHTFYVLTLGEQGTFVYDFSTGEWSQWQTEGLQTWNMEIGTIWKGKVVAADQSNPTIWQLTPLSFIDDGFKTMTRVVTGGLSVRQRMVVPNYAFRITASMGSVEVGSTFPATTPTIELEYSDDQGNTFGSAGEIPLVSGSFMQRPQWLSLGVVKAPSRVFRITDVGGIARLDGADAEIEEDEDSQ